MTRAKASTARGTEGVCLVALAFAWLHLPTYLSAPISGESAIRDLSVMVIVIPFAICFRILITFAYNRTRFSVLIAAISPASFNEASEIISPNVPGVLAPKLWRSLQSDYWHYSPR
jgi:hypothetical protein